MELGHRHTMKGAGEKDRWTNLFLDTPPPGSSRESLGTLLDLSASVSICRADDGDKCDEVLSCCVLGG
jgi:hypothetical protein